MIMSLVYILFVLFLLVVFIGTIGYVYGFFYNSQVEDIIDLSDDMYEDLHMHAEDNRVFTKIKSDNHV